MNGASLKPLYLSAYTSMRCIYANFHGMKNEWRYRQKNILKAHSYMKPLFVTTLFSPSPSNQNLYSVLASMVCCTSFCRPRLFDGLPLYARLSVLRFLWQFAAKYPFLSHSEHFFPRVMDSVSVSICPCLHATISTFYSDFSVGFIRSSRFDVSLLTESPASSRCSGLPFSFGQSDVEIFDFNSVEKHSA